MRPGPVSISVIVLLLAASCGRSETGLATAADGPGVGDFWVKTTLPGASSIGTESFTLNAALSLQDSSCQSSKVGACTVNPCPAPARLFDVGTISVVDTAIATAAIDPQADGSYLKKSFPGEVPWTTGGATFSVECQHFPGDATQAGGSAQVVAPPYVTLNAESAFASAPGTLGRAQDLSIAWTPEGPSTAHDRMLVYLRSGATQVECAFAVSDGAGVVPAEVLQLLDPGEGSFDLHTGRNTSQKVTGASAGDWQFSFNIDATARAPYGPALGSVVFQ